MMGLKLKKLYLSALSIVLVVLVLFVFISISTYRNLDRAENNAMAFLHQQGRDLAEVLSAVFKSSGQTAGDIFKQTAAESDIAYVYGWDNQGAVTFRFIAPGVEPPSFQGVQTDTANEEQVRIITLPNKVRVYELAKIATGNFRMVIGLKMTAFDEARRADLHHAIIMLAIVGILGVGALFFFVVIHNYYSVENTLEKTQEKVRRAEKLAAVGKLAAGVAHEIRNPLSSIRGFAKFLSHTLKDRPEEKEYADIMVREVDRINKVVSDLLTYARPMALARTRVDLAELVDHTLRLVSADAGNRSITIVRHIPDHLNQLWLDPGQITQALLNLLLNSLQAVDENGRIEVAAGLDSASGLLHLWVEDDGGGVDPGDLDKILDPFFTTRDKGTGLGLAIVHKIVENHQGELRIFSPVPGKTGGTRISLLIPGTVRRKEKVQDETENSRGR